MLLLWLARVGTVRLDQGFDLSLELYPFLARHLCCHGTQSFRREFRWRRATALQDLEEDPQRKDGDWEDTGSADSADMARLWTTEHRVVEVNQGVEIAAAQHRGRIQATAPVPEDVLLNPFVGLSRISGDRGQRDRGANYLRKLTRQCFEVAQNGPEGQLVLSTKHYKFSAEVLDDCEEFVQERTGCIQF